MLLPGEVTFMANFSRYVENFSSFLCSHVLVTLDHNLLPTMIIANVDIIRLDVLLEYIIHFIIVTMMSSDIQLVCAVFHGLNHVILNVFSRYLLIFGYKWLQCRLVKMVRLLHSRAF